MELLGSLNPEIIQTCESLQKLASEKMYARSNLKRDPGLAIKYPNSFFLKDGNTGYDIQINNLNNSKRDVVNVTVDGEVNKVDLVACFWTTEKSNESGKGISVRYGLGVDGNWYRQSGTDFTHDEKYNVDTWSLGEAKKMNKAEIKVEIFNSINKLQKPTTKPQP